MPTFDVSFKVDVNAHDSDLMNPNGVFASSLLEYYKLSPLGISEIIIKEEVPELPKIEVNITSQAPKPGPPIVKAGRGEKR